MEIYACTDGGVHIYTKAIIVFGILNIWQRPGLGIIGCFDSVVVLVGPIWFEEWLRGTTVANGPLGLVVKVGILKAAV